MPDFLHLLRIVQVIVFLLVNHSDQFPRQRVVLVHWMIQQSIQHVSCHGESEIAVDIFFVQLFQKSLPQNLIFYFHLQRSHNNMIESEGVFSIEGVDVLDGDGNDDGIHGIV